MIKKIATTLTRAGLACSLLSSAFASAATVDLLVLYDNGSKDYFSGDPQTAMVSWVNQINAAYRDSQVDIQLRLVGVRPYEGVKLDDGPSVGKALTDIRTNPDVIALRDQLGADFVSQLKKGLMCGLGYFSVMKEFAFNLVGPDCGPLTMAHELGHGMGLNHSRRQGDTTGFYSYGLGYGVDNVFSTIMTYPEVFNTTRFNRFSNPTIQCRGLPCGVPVGQPDEAYAALALQNVRDEIAAFRSSTVVSGPVRVSQHCNYGGYTVALPVGSYTAAQLQARGITNDDISSLRVESGYKVTLYQHDNFTGNALAKTGDVSCLVGDGFNDVATSIVVAQNTTGFSQTVQAENYSAFNGVQLENTTDSGGGQNVGWIDAGDWMAYNSINIPTTGTYTIEYRVASMSGGGRLSLDLNGGTTVLGEINIPSTGGWQNWTTVSQTVTINAGTYNFGIFAQTGGWNINWWRIKR